MKRDDEEKMKVLMLGYHDSKLPGHIQSEYLNMPDNVEAYMVTLVGRYGKAHHCFHRVFKSPYAGLLHLVLDLLYKWIYSLLFFRSFPIVDKKHSEYAFFDFEYYPISAKRILKKCPKGFIPDIISVHWDSGFASSRVIKELHERTGAKIVYHFVDEAPLTGGCHYPVDCVNYLNGCNNCPALKIGKKLAAKQLESKMKNLSGLPIYLCGTPYDMRLAEKSQIYKGALIIPVIHNPDVVRMSRSEARKQLDLSDSSFVVFLGASHLNDPRKGMSYSIKAIEKVAKLIPELVVLAAGSSELKIENAEVKNLGYVQMEQLFTCFCAADCFLSTTIADSGPMMVNYSFALGTPVVSFPIGVADDLIVHKETGYLATYKDVEDVAKGILFLRGLNEDERNSMSERCVKIINDKSIKGSWVDLITAYGN